jgi:hypothetical protein
MEKNVSLYNAAVILIEASKFINEIDKEFAITLLDKAEKFKKMIHVDEKENKEIVKYKNLIKGP